MLFIEPFTHDSSGTARIRRANSSPQSLGQSGSGPTRRHGDDIEVRGRVHSVETFGAVDGPGIRYLVFMQGCPLRCKFCQNRDTWDTRGGTEYSVRELFSDIRRYRPYFVQSSGGVTVTGGEPLLQAGFVADLFSSCHDAEIHTAVDTSGFASITPEVERLLESTDLVILDIKQIDDVVHRDLVGASNRLVLEFARELARHRTRTWVRHIVIPGYTTGSRSARRTAAFIASLGNVQRVELFRYHELGRHKWEALGLRYPLAATRPPTEGEMSAVKAAFEAAGLRVRSA